MYMAATHTKTFRPVNMVSPIFSHYLTLHSPRQTTSPAASTSYGQQGRQTGQNCLLGCGSWASLQVHGGNVLTIGAGASLSGAGTVIGALAGSGVIKASGG